MSAAHDRAVHTAPHVAVNGAFRAGCYEDAANPYLASSSCWEAFEIGRWMRDTNAATPLADPSIRASRGSTYRLLLRDGGEQLVKVRYHGKGRTSVAPC